MRVIYLDILCLTNLTFDLMALYLTAKITKCPIRLWMCLLMSIFGAVCGTWLTVFCQSRLLFALVALVALSLTVVFSFRPSGFRAFLRLGLLFSFMLFLCGALAYFVLRFCITRFGITEGNGANSKVFLFILISLLSGSVLAFTSGVWKKQSSQNFVSVKIKIGKKERICTCLSDSGCLLKDPISGYAVIFITKKDGRALFPIGDLHWLCKTDGFSPEMLSDENRKRVRLVPCRTVTGGKLLMCIQPDLAEISGIAKRALVSVREDDSVENGICPTSLLE